MDEKKFVLVTPGWAVHYLFEVGTSLPGRWEVIVEGQLLGRVMVFRVF